MRCDYCGWMNAQGAERCIKCNQILPENDSSVSEQTSSSQPSIDFSSTVAIKSNGSSSEKGNDCMQNCPSCGYPLAFEATECPACKAKIISEDVTQSNVISVDEKKSDEISTDVTPKDDSSSNYKQTIRDLSQVVKQVEQKSNVAISGSEKVDFKSTVRDFGSMNAVSVNEASKRDSRMTVRDIDLLNVQDNKKCSLVPMDNFDGRAKDIEVMSDSFVLNRGNVDEGNVSIDEKEQALISFEDGSWYLSNLSVNNATFICTDRKMKIETGDIIIIGNRRFIFK